MVPGNFLTIIRPLDGAHQRKTQNFPHCALVKLIEKVQKTIAKRSTSSSMESVLCQELLAFDSVSVGELYLGWKANTAVRNILLKTINVEYRVILQDNRIQI